MSQQKYIKNCISMMNNSPCILIYVEQTIIYGFIVPLHCNLYCPVHEYSHFSRLNIIWWLLRSTRPILIIVWFPERELTFVHSWGLFACGSYGPGFCDSTGFVLLLECSSLRNPNYRMLLHPRGTFIFLNIPLFSQ